MKRKIIICTFVLTTLLLSGCTRKNTQGTENTSVAETNHTSTDAAGNSASTDTAHSTVTSESHTTQDSTDAAYLISEEEAKQIALAHAELTADQVTFIKSGIDREDGQVYYDVEFYTKDHKEYDYDIDPYTGEILDYDHDAEYYGDSTGVDTTNGTATGDGTTAGDGTAKTDGTTKTDGTAKGDEISADEAKKIALAKVPGATTQDIREFKSDYDNGKLEYEGKIYYEQKEYEFEIDAYTGAILEWDVEPVYGGVSGTM